MIGQQSRGERQRQRLHKNLAYNNKNTTNASNETAAVTTPIIMISIICIEHVVRELTDHRH